MCRGLEMDAIKAIFWKNEYNYCSINTTTFGEYKKLFCKTSRNNTLNLDFQCNFDCYWFNLQKSHDNYSCVPGPLCFKPVTNRLSACICCLLITMSIILELCISNTLISTGFYKSSILLT